MDPILNVGVFIPIGNNGWLISDNAPQYKPSFELNKNITLTAEAIGIDFVLSMIKLRGFGGKTEFWDHNLESFTLMAGLAAVTTRIKLFGTAPTLCLPPAIVARMASTIDSISNGRFGVNLVTGWQKPEYDQMGLWPGDEYFNHRYEYLSEYAQVLRDLWGAGRSDLKGEFFQMNDCRLSPRPRAEMKIICAGQSSAGMEFTAKYADYNFCFGKGVNTPTAPDATALIVVDMQNADATTGRYRDRAGFDVTGTGPVIGQIARVVTAARTADIRVVWVQNGWDPDDGEAGGPGSPNRHKSNAVKTMRRRPAWDERLPAKGTWDDALVEALQPEHRARRRHPPSRAEGTAGRRAARHRDRLRPGLGGGGVRGLREFDRARRRSARFARAG